MVEIKTNGIDFIVKHDYVSLIEELNKPDRFISITYYQLHWDNKTKATYYERVATLNKDEIERVEPSIIYVWDDIKDNVIEPNNE